MTPQDIATDIAECKNPETYGRMTNFTYTFERLDDAH